MKMLILTAVILGGIPAYAQSKKIERCTLTPEQSPPVRGLKLGQPIAELVERFPESYRSSLKREKDEVGISKALLNPTSLRDPELLKGVRILRLTYMDDKLAEITVHYDGTATWESDGHFASAIAQQLHLPAAGWVNQNHPRLDCDGFSVEAWGASIGGVLTVSRPDLDEEVVRRKEALEQKKRIEFKP